MCGSMFLRLDFLFDKFIATRRSWIDSLFVVVGGVVALALFGIVLRSRLLVIN
ncbi:hypothetical protein HanIR_Chr17g0879431 [Helianthus annuus]|nr:hypothetical protein HanIR_Chr17g0879431 [Helianthus annuus]